MHRVVAKAGDEEADDARLPGELSHDAKRHVRVTEGQEREELDPRLLRAEPLGEPPVVGVGDLRLALGQGAHSEREQGRREDHLGVDAHRVHRSSAKDDVAVHAVVVHLLVLAALVGNPAEHVLEAVAGGERGVHVLRRTAPRHATLEMRAHHGILDVLPDLVPRRGRLPVRVDVDDEVVIEPSLFCLNPRVVQ